MIIKKEVSYTFTLSEEEALDIIREIDDVYKGILDTGAAFEAIDKLMAIKNALAVQMAGSGGER